MLPCARCGARACTAHGASSRSERPPPALEAEPLVRAGYGAPRLIGSGGFGTVFAAVPPSGGAEVAVKIARREQPLSEARLMREAEALDAAERTPTTLAAATLVGRDDVLDRLVAAARRALAGAPAAAGVLADAGYGKSHLAVALADRLRRALPQAEIVRLVAHTPADGGPDRTLRELLLWALDLPAEKPPGAGPRLLDARIGGGLGRLWPSVAVGLGWADPDDADVRRLRAAPGALRAAAAQVAGEALRSRAARRPLIVLLDDAHLADEVTLDALDYAVRAEAGAPILAVALARPSFESARPSWGARAASREDVRLGPLDPGHAAALCRSLLAPAEDIPARGERRTREPRLG